MLNGHSYKKVPQAAFALLLKTYGVNREEFENKMRLQHNGSNKAINKAENLINAMLRNGIESVDVTANKTKNNEYYRTEAQSLLKLIIKLRY